ncbi:TlpA disulfide reductase family protein [Methylobacterium radiodurans]|nr:TlpA disulfide reductase family protein [Methylobacterium radiodurans]
MSNPDAGRLTRRAFAAGALSTITLSSPTAALPLLRGQRKQFVHFEPQPSMQPLRLRDLAGRTATLAAAKREAMRLYVWATWCPSCPVELPRLAREQAAIAARGVGVVAVSIDTVSTVVISTYLQRHGAGGLRVLHDPAAATLRAGQPDGTASPFQSWSMPLTFAVDRAARVRGYIAGGFDWLKPDSLAFLDVLAAQAPPAPFHAMPSRSG